MTRFIPSTKKLSRLLNLRNVHNLHKLRSDTEVEMAEETVQVDSKEKKKKTIIWGPIQIERKGKRNANDNRPIFERAQESKKKWGPEAAKGKKHNTLKPLVKDDFVSVSNKVGVSIDDDSLEVNASFVDMENREAKRGDTFMQNCSVDSSSEQIEIGQLQGVPHSQSVITDMIPSMPADKDSGRVEKVVGGRKKNLRKVSNDRSP